MYVCMYVCMYGVYAQWPFRTSDFTFDMRKCAQFISDHVNFVSQNYTSLYEQDHVYSTVLP